MKYESRSPSMPANLDKSFNNVEDILNAMTDEGMRNLDFSASRAREQDNKILITQFGVACQMQNREGQTFSVLVMNKDISSQYGLKRFRRQIVESAKAIKKNFR